MSPFTNAQQAFLDQMTFNNTDERAMVIIRAAFKLRNNDGLRSENSVKFARDLDLAAG
tara:strand:- start:1352 stop:1525 length:174 start_codon:yes stop_codon:yes gene_type:complete